MGAIMRRTIFTGLLPVAALTLCAIPAAHAQDPRNVPTVEFIAANSHPAVPPGLQLMCMPVSGNGAPNSETCPVVKYHGVSTWAFSYADNRDSLALVTYDADNKIVRNVEKPGARYLFNASVSYPNQTVTFIGQAEKFVTVPWSDIGPAQ
jgi:hypothetical protein